MMINIAICDDNAIEINQVKQLVEEYVKLHKYSYCIDVYQRAEDLLHSAKSYELIFLDVEFDNEDKNGIYVAKKIRERDKRVAIIFISNSDSPSYLKAGYGVNAQRYFTKPLDQNEFFFELDSLMKEFLLEDMFIVNEKASRHKIFFKDIIYIEFMNRRSVLHMTRETLIVNISLKEWMKQLSGCGFAKTHKAFIVNLRRISGLRTEFVILENEDEVPLSRTYRDKFREEYFNHIKGLM